MEQLYIGGEYVDSRSDTVIPVENPAPTGRARPRAQAPEPRPDRAVRPASTNGA
jgi:hypothetical protein